jgi:CysZ protein
MRSIQYHVEGIVKTIQALLQGKYLIYFIPGTIITIIYWYIMYRAASIADSISLETGYSLIDKVTGVIDTGIDYFFSFIALISEQIYIYVIITLLAPFGTFLAEQFDTQLTGKKFEGGFIRLINDFFRMVLVVIIAITLEFGFMLLYWMFSWLFPDIVDTIVYHLIAAFFFGFSFYDFHLERYRIGVLGSLGYAFENMWTMVITGSIFLLIFSIPFVGIPLAPILIIMISTVVYLRKEKLFPNIADSHEKTQNESNSSIS